MRDAVVFACDAGHLAYAWVAAQRVAQMEPERRFDVIVASPDIAEVPAELLQPEDNGGVRFVFLDPSPLPEIRAPSARISGGAFFRFLLPAALGHEYRALLYMDTDTWLRRPGVQALFDAITTPFAIAAVPDFVPHPALGAYRSLAGRLRAKAQIADQGGPGGEYWQSGVLLMQTAPFEVEGLAARIFARAAADQGNHKRARLGDQSAMNRVAAGEIALLDPRWNWHNYRWLRTDLVARFDPFVLHFSGAAKPWRVSDDLLAEAVRPEWEAAMRRWTPDWRATRLKRKRPGLLGRLRQKRHRIGTEAENAMAALIASSVIG